MTFTRAGTCPPQHSLKKEELFVTEQEFGQRLRQYRRARHLTQQELADRLGVSNKSVSRWESGGYPDVVTLAPLARALGVTVDELLGCQPPLRTLQPSDWQNLLSYGFALGGGVLFYALDLFLPALVSYLLYLAMMAYGVYLQRHYTYRSRWFYGANTLMNLFINIRLTSFLAFSWLSLAGQWMVLSSDSSFSINWEGLLRNWTYYLPRVVQVFLPQLLAVLALSGITQFIIWKTGGHTLAMPKLCLRWRKPGVPQIIPAFAPFVLMLFWLPYNSSSPLPGWCYRYQFILFLGLWAAVSVFIFLMVRRRRERFLPALVMQLGCLSLPNFVTYTREYSTISGKFFPASSAHNASIYLAFGQPTHEMLLTAVMFTVLYLVLCLIQIEVQSIQKEETT